MRANLDNKLRDLRLRGILSSQQPGVLSNPLRVSRSSYSPPQNVLTNTIPEAPPPQQQSSGGGPPVGMFMNQGGGQGGGLFNNLFSGGSAAGGASGGGGGGGSSLSGVGPWAALAAVIAGNEREARRGGYRDENDMDYALDLLGGKVLEQDFEKRWSEKLSDIHPTLGAHGEAAANIATFDFSNAWDDLRRGFKDLF